MSKHAKHVEPSLTKVWNCSRVCRKIRKIEIMPPITEHDVCCRVVKKLEKVRMLSYSFAWNVWVRRVKSQQLKESVAVRLRQIHVSAIYWEVWKKHMEERPVRIKQLLSIVICWEVWKELMETSKAFDEFYAEWQDRKEPNIIIC